MDSNSISLRIPTRTAKISENFSVRRILPYRSKRSVGPFCFIDHMGPHTLHGDPSEDVLVHPHIGISTLTYLFEGHIDHRDSTGALQTIHPGDVNWMTAGSGIAHSERISKDNPENGILHGLQAWIALPKHLEETSPFFKHYASAQIPQTNNNGVQIYLIAGKAHGLESPVEVSSDLFYLDLNMESGSEYGGHFLNQEAAFYLVDGAVEIDQQIIEQPELIVFKENSEIKIKALKKTRAVLFGGTAFPEERYMFWNFVSSSKERLEKAKSDWKQQLFPKVPGETGYVPLPSESKK